MSLAPQINSLHSFLNRSGLRRPLSILRQGLLKPSTLLTEYKYHQRFLDFSSKFGNFLGENPSKSSGRKVLVVSLFDIPSMIEFEGALVKALQVHGAEPVVLCSTRDRSHAFFQLYGLKNILYFDDMVRAAQARPETFSEPLTPVDEFKSNSELREYTYRGVHVGRHVLSIVSRTLREGQISLSNPNVAAAIKDVWPRIPATVQAARDVFDQVTPHTSFFLEIGYFPYGELFEVSLERGVNTVEWMGSHRQNSLNLKRYTPDTAALHPQSLSPGTWDKLKKNPWTPKMEKELFNEIETHYESGGWTNEERLQYGKKIKTVDDVKKQLGLDPAKKTAVIFSHILWDATFFYGRDLFENYAEWLIATVRAACENQNLNWVVKLHPANIWKLIESGAKGELNEVALLRKTIGTLPDHIKLVAPSTDINTFSFFDLTDYCLTVRGTIGIEMSCYGIPTIVAGTGRYAGYGFTVDSNTVEDYLDKLRHLHGCPRLNPEQIERAKKHAHAVFLRRPLDLKTIQTVLHTDNKSGGLTERDTVINAKTIQEFAAASDIQGLSRWVLDSKELDYLNY